MKRRMLAGVAVMALAFTLSGCMRFTAEYEVSEDNLVSGAYVIAVESGTGEALGVSDREAAEDLYEESGLAEQITQPHIRGYSSGGYTGIEVRFRHEELENFAPTSERFGITRKGDEFVVSGPVSAIGEGNEDVMEGAIMTVAITFPGAVTRGNGQIDGNTVEWDLVGGPSELKARASAISNASALPAVVATALVIIAAAAVLYSRVGQNSRPPAPPSPSRSATKPTQAGRSTARAGAPSPRPQHSQTRPPAAPAGRPRPPQVRSPRA